MRRSHLVLLCLLMLPSAARPDLPSRDDRCEREASLELGGHRASIALRALGRGDALLETRASATCARAERLDLRRADLPGVVEWWQRASLGMEHGVTIDRRPLGDGPLALELDVEGLTPRTIRPDAIALEDHDIAVAQYSGLAVIDATGARIPASMRAIDRRIAIEVDDAQAIYPLVVDPVVFTLEHVLPPGNPPDCTSIAISGDGLHAICNTNPARMWSRTSGTWTLETSNFAVGTYGTAVAIDRYGQVAVIASGTGALTGTLTMVFNDQTGHWSQGPTIRNVAADAVAISPDGAYVWGGGPAGSQLFLGSSVIAYTLVTGYPGGAASSAAFSGDTTLLAVGNAAANGGQGGVMVYSTSSFVADTPITSPSGAMGLGSSVSLSQDGSHIMIGAPSLPAGGWAEAWFRSGTTWYRDGSTAANSILYPSNPASGDRFGASVAISNDGLRAFVAAPGLGCVYAFVRNPSSWGASQGSVCGAAGVFATSMSASAGGTRVAISRDPTMPTPMQGGAIYVVPGPNGAACGDGSDCTSGHCVSGLCCNTSCGTAPTDPQCQACSHSRTGYPDGTCAPLSAAVAPTVMCRAASGACDVSEFCSPSTVACPMDGFMPRVLCRGASDLCDVPEYCTGTGSACPADGFEPSSLVCRLSTGDCDPPERCTGTSATCPTDALAPATAICRTLAGPCDVAEHCDGTTPDCPMDTVAARGMVCAPSTGGVCDVPDVCTGVTTDCPATYAVGIVCRAPAGSCDVPEVCLGSSANCPPDAVLASGVDCRPSTASCDPAESCDGTAAGCPPDVNMCTTQSDSGTGTHDAGPDAGVDAASAADASSMGDAASTRDAGGTSTPPAASGSCGCSTQRPRAGLGLALLLLAFVAGRRRRDRTA